MPTFGKNKMAKIKFKDLEVNTIGELPLVGSELNDFELVGQDLSVKKISDFSGKRKVLNIFPSIDTGVCATSVKKFNSQASQLENTIIINISKDLPFALGRFCGAEGIENVETLSDFRGNFGDKLGLTLQDSPLKGLLARAVVVLDENNKVIHTELVEILSNEPNYEKVLSILK